MYILAVACAEFILAGAEKNQGGAESRPKGAKKIAAPPVFYSAPPGRIRFCPWGRTDKRGGRN